MTSSSRLVQLFSQQGQSPWLDNLKRSLISSGELVKVRETGIRGLTSNPTIFQKAIQGSADYDEQFQSLIQNHSSIIDSYWAMVLQDIHGALDVFAPVYTSSGGTDGFVSVEVDPNFFEGNYYTGALMLEKSRAILAELNSLTDSEWEKRSKEMGTQADELYKQAVPYFTKALEIKPDNTDIMIILFQVHTRLKNTAEVNALNAKISAILGANWQEN